MVKARGTRADGGGADKWLEHDALVLLTEFGRRDGGRLSKFSAVVDECFPRDEDHTRRDCSPERDSLDRTAHELASLLPEQTSFWQISGSGQNKATFATPAAERAVAAAERIVFDRRRVIQERDQLERLQLASAIDTRPLRIGGYQAHYERFLGRALLELRNTFPWIQPELTFEASRDRSDPDVRTLLDKYEANELDYMLIPDDKHHRDAEANKKPCYTYTFRVIGMKSATAATMPGIPIQRLKGQTLVAAPAGFSSRDRVAALMKEHNVTPGHIIQEESPLMVRVRALAGEAIAVLPDEYTAVGTAQYPPLLVDNEPHRVKMRLISRPGCDGGVHAAFAYVVDRLRRAEDVARDRHPAALDH